MIEFLNKTNITVFLCLYICLCTTLGCNHVGTTTHTTAQTQDMPSASQLGVMRGKHFERVITHFHTPFSFDACDGMGTVNGKPNLQCAQGIFEAICSNRINYIFASDHAHYMAAQKFEDLLFTDDPSEQLIASVDPFRGRAVARRVRCKNGHQGFFVPGVEGRLLGLGMSRHITQGDLAHRYAIYMDDTAESAKELREQSEALIVIPHTESRAPEIFERTKPDAMEIYNFHANFDPTIRYKNLGASPIRHLLPFLDYILNPYGDLDPDYLFMEFVEFFPVYFEKWNALLAQGKHVTGLGGTDAHQNVIAQTMSDGERLDSYRRMSLFMTHFVLVDSPAIAFDQFQDYLNVKSAIKKGRVYFVLEGLGTPVGMDFTASSGKEMGDTVSLQSKPVLSFKMPKVLEDSPGVKEFGQPPLRAELIYVGSDGKEVIAHNAVSDFNFNQLESGTYRVKVLMVPRHLKRKIRRGTFTEQEYPWILSNPIYVTR